MGQPAVLPSGRPVGRLLLSSSPMSVVTERRTLTVRLFARFAELLGTDELSVPAEEIATVQDLLAWIRRLPNGAGVADSALVAVNLVQARAEAPLTTGDEIALLPPLAGG